MDGGVVNSVFREGELFSDKAFMSTSSDPRSSFIGDVQLTVQSKSGVHVSDASAFPYESEVLFRPGSVFIVKSKFKNADGSWEIELEEV